jgi:hypothetical protein
MSNLLKIIIVLAGLLSLVAIASTLLYVGYIIFNDLMTQ